MQNPMQSTPEKPRKGLAIASLVLGIIGIPTLGLSFVGGIAGIVLGAIALNKAKSNPAQFAGKGLALAGIVISALSMLSIVVPEASRSIARTRMPGATPTSTAAAATYKIDAAQSRFMVKAFAGGFLSALAHDHNIAIRDFSGDAQFTFGTVEPASLQLKIRSGSLAVTDKVSASDRQKIETTMRDEVLEVGTYPEIVFKSTSVSAAKTGEGQYQARIAGELTLHGVTKALTITAQLEFGDSILRARGAFSVKQSSFGIKPVSVAGGTIKVKDELKFTFEIVARP